MPGRLPHRGRPTAPATSLPYDHPVSDDRAEVMQQILDETYAEAEHAALMWQTQAWRESRPLAGMRVLDATPVFHNTLAKYVPLLAAGADLSVWLSPVLPHGPATADLLRRIGVSTLDTFPVGRTYDVVLDCAGVLATAGSRAGYVELTKSGQHVYEDCPRPVLMADDSRIKLIETTLGTGDGFIRGLAHFGHTDLSGQSVVVFGCGKVGRGAAWHALRAGAVVALIDPDPAARAPSGCVLIDANDSESMRATVQDAWCIASATGVAGALSPLCGLVSGSDAILVNLGAEDEYGPDMPHDRVLNAKAPVNFVLAEPTGWPTSTPPSRCTTRAVWNCSAAATRPGSAPRPRTSRRRYSR